MVTRERIIAAIALAVSSLALMMGIEAERRAAQTEKNVAKMVDATIKP